MAYHPFWIVILLAAVQHGVFVGLSVVGLATMMMDWPTRPVGMDITEHYVDVATAPAQWLIAALLIGLYRQSQIRHERALEADNGRLREINRTLAEEIHRLDAFVARAELAAAARGPSFATEQPDGRFEALHRLANADAKDRIAAFVEAGRACLSDPVGWLQPDAAGEMKTVAVTSPDAALPQIALADFPPEGSGVASFPQEGQYGCTDLPYLRLADAGDDGGVLVALPSDSDRVEAEFALGVLGHALSHSLKQKADATVDESREPNLADA
ncbi:hypothetical protein MLD63_13465 [Paracoccus sp. TK19116]|uniref:GAF domain-containing protein n=1 Tax=Paracoccus albicereus TaxID=2922394 RepID=A0ABT1MSY2_9RHOB|nr:hypothetical protein [Paracoccus albicereus]MCQ0971429.1 hypothetical protein [Paracoccus albicereus]